MQVLCQKTTKGAGISQTAISVLLKKLLLFSSGYVFLGHPVHVYYSNIQRSSSLKLLGQSKPNFMRSIVRKWE